MVLPLPEKNKAPFELKGDKGNVLLLHGFTGTPYEMRPVANALNDKGFSCLAPLLPGHGTDEKDLSNFHHTDWLRAANRAFDTFPNNHPKVLVGLSMGGLIATILASERREQIDALILLAPAFVLRLPGRLTAYAASYGAYRLIPQIKKTAGSDVGDPEGRSKNPSYKSISIRALKEFRQMQKLARKAVKNVRCPTFVAYGQKDHTVDVDKSFEYTKEIPSITLDHHFYPRSQHIISIDYERDALINDILEFCEKISEK